MFDMRLEPDPKRPRNTAACLAKPLLLALCALVSQPHPVLGAESNRRAKVSHFGAREPAPEYPTMSASRGFPAALSNLRLTVLADTIWA